MRHRPLRDYSDASAELAYGEDPHGYIVHISAVDSGLACGCVCPGCGEPLVAKKGEVRSHYFSHKADTGCRGAAETALHKLAKQIVAQELRLHFPEMRASVDGKFVVVRPAQVMRFDRAVQEETSLKAIVPDVMVWVKDHRMAVEILVTHACPPEKIAYLKENSLAALEIDLSRLARDAGPAEVIAAVIENAPRRWVFNPVLEQRKLELQEAAIRRKEDAERQIRLKRQTLIDAYNSGVKALTGRKSIPLLADDPISRLDFSCHLGVNVPGYACFSDHSSVWQYKILKEIIDRDRLGGSSLSIAESLKLIKEQSGVRAALNYVSKEEEAYLSEHEQGFRSPYQAIGLYLDYLSRQGVIEKRNATYALSYHVSHALDEFEAMDIRKAEKRAEVLERASRILDMVPMNERNGLTAAVWFRQPILPFGLSFAAAIEDDHGQSAEMVRLLAQIERMISSNGPICEAALGLPIAEVRKREVEVRRIRENERQAAKAEAARVAAERRKASVEAELFRHLGKDAPEWMDSLRPQFDGCDILTVVEESDRGAAQVLDALRREVAHREAQERRQQEIESYRTILRDEATRSLGPERAHVFLASPYPELGRQKPAIYCRDKSTLEKCRVILEKVRRGKR